MANRRMFSKTITNSDLFLDMPVSSRELYFQLGMEADDDGFVQSRSVMRMIGASDDDLRVLVAKKLVLEFEDRVIVIRDWKINNEIRIDRYKPTFYADHKAKLTENSNKQYLLDGTGTQLVLPENNRLDTQVRLGKDRIGKDRIGEDARAKLQQEFQRIDVEFEYKKFCDYYDSHNKVLKNWLAGFRNWLRSGIPKKIRQIARET